MTIDVPQSFWLYFIFFVLVVIDGFYCVLATRNLIRVLIGLELLIKGASFFIIASGYLTGRVALAQAIVITVIVIEVVMVVIGAGAALGFYRRYNSLDVRNAHTMKG
jgi:multisubunit Na+/H+ antiporter MnhC subunit